MARVDITPAELRPGEGLAASVAAGRSEPCASPVEVPNWPQRQAQAIVPFGFDAEGWPVNPAGPTGKAGRNLARWGENQAADPIVVAGHGAQRRVLLIRRDDVGQWAIPGGMVDPGETAPAALVRELAEETHVDLTTMRPTVLTRTYVDDWRASDHAWVCSTVALFRLDTAPHAVADDDAAEAGWFPFTSLDALVRALDAHGGMYPAHEPLLSSALDALRDD